MIFLSSNKIKRIFLFSLCLLGVSNHSIANKITDDSNFTIITMKPIADDNDANGNANLTPHIKTVATFQGIKTKNLNRNRFFVDKKSILSEKTISPNELKCLAQTIYFEAKSEPYNGGVAVGNVVINRVKSGKFPNTICGVMSQKTGKMCQFSFMCNGQINQKLNQAQWKQSKKIALDILTGKAPQLSNGALFFHAKYAKLRLASNRYTARIGHHYFYK